MKVRHKKTGSVLKYKENLYAADYVSTTAFIRLFLRLYKKATYCNPLTITVHGGPNGDEAIYFDPK